MFNSLILSGLVGVLITTSLSAQSVVSERKPKTEEDLGKYDLKSGNLYTDLSYKMKLGYDDNTTSDSQSSQREEGTYLVNGLEFNFYAPVNENFSIDTGFYIGYKNWLSGNNDDGLIVDLKDGDTLALDWRINELTTLSLVDRLKINVQEIQSSRDNQGISDLKLLENDIGLQLFQELSEEARYGLKIGQNNIRSLNGDFEERERDDYYMGLEYQHDISAKLTVVPYVTFRTYNWSKEFNNDANEFQSGLIFKYNASELIYTELTLGYQYIDFDGALSDSRASGLEGKLLVNHTISDQLDHSLYVVRNSRISYSTAVNYSEDWLFNYTFNWQVNSKLKLSPKFQWYVSEDQVRNGENYDIFNPGITLTYDLSEKLSLELTYSYQQKSSNTQFEYDRTEYYMALTYDF